jgi:hypothetical protein
MRLESRCVVEGIGAALVLRFGIIAFVAVRKALGEDLVPDDPLAPLRRKIGLCLRPGRSSCQQAKGGQQLFCYHLV